MAAYNPPIMGLGGARFGSCEIVRLLGSGGMGEVYLARDRRLGREVAVKILPSSLAADPDRLSRFEREARVLASLNNPHIAAIHGIEESGGVHGLVLELVEGETLAERLALGRLSVVDAAAIARQIAEALDAAHEKGIVHRDLKPANIKITPDGVVKVLDFGLAKADALDGDVGAPRQHLTNSPTILPNTRDGIILGTPAYMSPEQARGRPVDKRADIWAFGCVLFEMLAGRAAFARETTTDTLAAVIEREPDWSALPASTPVGVERVVRRCLEKEMKRRLRDIADALSDLQDAAESTPAADSPSTHRAVGPRLVWSLAFVLLAGLAATGWWPDGAQRAREVRLHRITDTVGIEESPAISPDGRTVAFVAPVGSRRQVWVQLLTGGAPLQITKDDADHFEPRWAPDSNALIYYTPGASLNEEGTLWEIPALGGVARPIARATGGGDISPDGGRVAIFQHRDEGVAMVAVSRQGAGSRLVRAFPSGAMYLSPRWSPDGASVAFQRAESADFDKRIYVVPVEGAELRQIARASDLRGFAWLPDGSGIVYSSSAGSTVLYPPTFNLRVVRRDGTDDSQVTFGDTSYVEPDTHRSGVLFASRIHGDSDIWRLGASDDARANTAAAVPITRRTSAAQTPSISPDGSEVVYLSDSGGHGNLWIAKTDGSGSRQLTFERDPHVSIGVPVWSSLGNAIVFIVSRDGVTGQWVVNPDGTGLRSLIPRGVWSFWAPEDRWLYYTVDRGGDYCIEKAPGDGGSSISVRCGAAAPALSPDGTTLYFAKPLRYRSGSLDWEIHRARPEDGPSELIARIPGTRVPVDSYNIHTIPSPDGRWLALPLSDGRTTDVWALSAENGSMRRLTDFGERPVVIARRISWSPDGKSIYAAVAEIDADVVSLEGILP